MKIEKETIQHPSHPQHKLEIECTKDAFRCDGCKEVGIGHKYKCSFACDFDLHKACALAPTAISHPFYKKCDFRFYQQPPGSVTRVCDACHKDVLGFVYHCKGCGFDLHPCCANLPQVLNDGERNLYLRIELSRPCHCCGGKGPGWCYRSECKRYTLHVACVKELLVENYCNWDKNKGTELQTRILSLRGMMANHHSGSGGKIRKFCQIAGKVVRVIIGAILGDPTAIIAAVVVGFMSK